jgi:hypothetical protein
VTHSNNTAKRPHTNRGNIFTSLLQQPAVPSESLTPHRYKTPHYKGTWSHPTTATSCSTKWFVSNTPLQDNTIPRDIIEPHCQNTLRIKWLVPNTPLKDATLTRDILSHHCYNKLQYQVTHSKHTNKWNSLTSLLQHAAVPSDF